MSLNLLEDIAAQSILQATDPEERYLISGVSWDEYEALLERLGDSPWYRVSYLEGVLEIMAPSRRHELSKDNITRLLNAYFEETRTRFYGLGSTTFRVRLKARGLEPDTCFCIGSEKEFPDIAIEVVETSGGIDKLAVYGGLGVPEVWFWQKQQFKIHHWRGEAYEQISCSELLPGLDLNLLAAYVPNPEPLDAVLEFRAKIREQQQ
jgi:Uma2 family endonuclease